MHRTKKLNIIIYVHEYIMIFYYNVMSLINIPPEILVHLSIFLDEVNIILLARTCWHLYHDVKSYVKMISSIHNAKQLWCFLAENGYLNLMKILNKKVTIDILRLEFAALGGHLDVLKWARENNCEWSKAVCANAALGGHLDILVWARENGCHWNSTVCAYAAKNGHLTILIWALLNNCLWRKTNLTTIMKRYPEIYIWLNAVRIKK